MAQQQDLHSVEGVLDTVVHAGDGSRVSVGDVVHEIGEDAFGPLMLVPALITVSPASGIPGLTSLGGICIALVAVQMVLMRRTLWLPGILLKRKINRKTLEKAVSWLRKPARIIDKVTRRRLRLLVKAPFALVPALICLAIGLVMPFMEVIPFSGSLAASAVSLFALAFTTEDGLLAILATLVVGGVGYLAWTTLM